MSLIHAKSRAGVIALISAVCALFAAVPANAQSATASSAHADAGSVWWNALISANPERSRAFYASVIGWSPKIVAAEDTSRPPAPGENEYTLFTQNGVESAGLAKYDGQEPTDPKPGWLTYIQVASVDDAVVEALKKGGKVIKAPTDAVNIGRIAVITDPDGNPIGLYAPSNKAANVAAH